MSSIFNFSKKDIALTLSEKLEKIELIIKNALSLSKNPLLLFSGGKDSILLLHLLLKFKQDIKVLLIDSNMNFPTFNEFLETKIKPKVKNFIHIKVPYSEKEYIKKFGIPFFRGVSNLGYSDEEIKKLGLTNECSRIKNEIMLKQEKIINPDLVFMGFLATESKKRLKRAQKWNYLKLSYSENVCIPLAMLKESEVFELMDELSIPYLKEAYFINKINTFCGGDGTCWMCSDSCFEKNLGGNWKLIKENFPSLWKKINEEYSFKEKLFELYKKTKNKKIKQTYNDLFKKHNS